MPIIAVILGEVSGYWSLKKF